MSSDDLADFWVHQVGVETYQGTRGDGTKLYAASVPVDCFLSRKRRFVRAANGEQVISESAFSADVSFTDSLTPESRVTVPGNPPTVTEIITVALSTSGDLDLPDRVKAYLQ